MIHILQQYRTTGSEYRWDQFSSLTSTLDLSYQNPTSCAPESFVYSLPGTEVYLLNDIFFLPQGLKNSELHPNTIPLQKSHIQAILHHLQKYGYKDVVSWTFYTSTLKQEKVRRKRTDFFLSPLKKSYN